MRNVHFEMKNRRAVGVIFFINQLAVGNDVFIGFGSDKLFARRFIVGKIV